MIELIVSVSLSIGLIVGFIIGQRVASSAMAVGLFVIGWAFGKAGHSFSEAWKRFRNILEE